MAYCKGKMALTEYSLGHRELKMADYVALINHQELICSLVEVCAGGKRFGSC